jgi:20S proteasome alpha/beta subunit
MNETINYICLAGSSADVKRLLKWLYTLEKEEIVNVKLMSSVEKHILDAKVYLIFSSSLCIMLLVFHLDLHGYYAFYFFMLMGKKLCRQNVGSNCFNSLIRRILKDCQRVAL